MPISSTSRRCVRALYTSVRVHDSFIKQQNENGKNANVEQHDASRYGRETIPKQWRGERKIVTNGRWTSNIKSMKNVLPLAAYSCSTSVWCAVVKLNGCVGIFSWRACRWVAMVSLIQTSDGEPQTNEKQKVMKIYVYCTRVHRIWTASPLTTHTNVQFAFSFRIWRLYVVQIWHKFFLMMFVGQTQAILMLRDEQRQKYSEMKDIQPRVHTSATDRCCRRPLGNMSCIILSLIKLE